MVAFASVVIGEAERIALVRSAEGLPAVLAVVAVAALLQWLVVRWDRAHPDVDGPAEAKPPARSGSFARDGRESFEDAPAEPRRKAS